jgi:hypothetical protein
VDIPFIEIHCVDVTLPYSKPGVGQSDMSTLSKHRETILLFYFHTVIGLVVLTLEQRCVRTACRYYILVFGRVA